MTTTGTTTAGRGTIWRRLRLHTWLGRLGWVGGLLVLVLLIGWLLMRATPGWYRPLDPSNDAVSATASQAESLLYFELNNAAQRVPLGDQTWTISQDQMNSFLAVHAQTALDPGRNPISDPYVVFSKGEVTLAARITKLPSGDPQGGVGSATFSVGIVTDADGTAKGLVKLKSVHAGLLAIPKSLVESRMRAMLPTVTTVADEVARVQLGRSSRPNGTHNLDALVEEVTRCVSMGEPFPLQVRVDGKDIVIKRMIVEEGRFTLVLGSPHLTATEAPLPAGIVPAPGLRGN